MNVRPDLPASPLSLRYGGDAPVGAPLWNEAIATMLAHRSVRAYRPDPLPAGALEAIVAAAQSASTSSNLQTWSVIAIEDQATKDRLAVLASNQKHISQCPVFLLWIADLARSNHVADMIGSTHAGNDYLEMFLVAAIDAAMAAQNAAVAAESLGLGMVYIGALRSHADEVAALVGLPDGAHAVFGMCVGYEDTSKPAHIKPRLPQAVALHRERYGAQPDEAAIRRYDAIMSRFLAEERLPDYAWSKRSSDRVAGPESLSNRDKLVAMLRRLGFFRREGL